MTDNVPLEPTLRDRPRAARLAYIGFGWVCVALGVVGIVLPVLPTTPFMILALWAFGRGSKRWHDWLHGHPRFGPPLQRWERYRVIPPAAKLLACVMMSASYAYVWVSVDMPVAAKIVLGLVLISVATYVVSRPSHPPQQAPGDSATATSDDTPPTKPPASA